MPEDYRSELVKHLLDRHNLSFGEDLLDMSTEELDNMHYVYHEEDINLILDVEE